MHFSNPSVPKHLATRKYLNWAICAEGHTNLAWKTFAFNLFIHNMDSVSHWGSHSPFAPETTSSPCVYRVPVQIAQKLDLNASGLTWIKWLIIRAQLEIHSAQRGEFAHHYMSASNTSYPKTGPFDLKLQATTAFFINLTYCYTNTCLISSGVFNLGKTCCFTVAFNMESYFSLKLRGLFRNYF